MTGYIYFTLLLHLTWLLILIFVSEVPETTTLAVIFHLFGPAWTVFLLAVSPMLALYSLTERQRWRGLLAILPQTTLLTISAGAGALVAVLTGRYADLVVHPPLFILADQDWVLLLAVCHWVAVLSLYHVPIWRTPGWIEKRKVKPL